MRVQLRNAMLLILALLSFGICSSGIATGIPSLVPLAPSTSPPRVPGPLPAIATFAGTDRITVWMVVVGVRPVAGSEDGGQEMVQRVRGYDYAIEDIRAFDMKGRAIARENLPRLLKRECQVVIAQAGSPIDAKHLRWLREDLLLLVVPEKPLAEWSATPEGKRVERDSR